MNSLVAVTLFVLMIVATACQRETATPRSSQDSPSPARAIEGPQISPTTNVQLGSIPKTAEIVYHEGGYIYVMDRNGENVTRITFQNSRKWEHVAVSYDRLYVVANEQLPNNPPRPGGNSRVWLFDLASGTEARLLPQFSTVGNGGVDWDRNGFIYFAAQEKDLIPNPRGRQEFIANAGSNDVYKVKLDGTGLQRLTNTPTWGESDVSVSEDGALVACGVLVIDSQDDAKNYSALRMLHTDGSSPTVMTTGGAPGITSVHDPEFSPDGKKIVFSKVNREVPPNFPSNPEANTAHDIYISNVDGTGLTRLTKPGAISIIPDWKSNLVVYTELNDKENYLGASIVPADGVDQTPKRIKSGASSPKWIP